MRKRAPWDGVGWGGGSRSLGEICCMEDGVGVTSEADILGLRIPGALEMSPLPRRSSRGEKYKP